MHVQACMFKRYLGSQINMKEFDNETINANTGLKRKG